MGIPAVRAAIGWEWSLPKNVTWGNCWKPAGNPPQVGDYVSSTNNPCFLIRPFNYCLRMSGLRHWSGLRFRSATRVQRVGRGQRKELECQGDNEPLWLVIKTFLFSPLSRKQVKTTAVVMAQVPCLATPQGPVITALSSLPFAAALKTSGLFSNPLLFGHYTGSVLHPLSIPGLSCASWLCHCSPSSLRAMGNTHVSIVWVTEVHLGF